MCAKSIFSFGLLSSGTIPSANVRDFPPGKWTASSFDKKIFSYGSRGVSSSILDFAHAARTSLSESANVSIIKSRQVEKVVRNAS
jgi:hypothetical protein